jgi:hypothetical protein
MPMRRPASPHRRLALYALVTALLAGTGWLMATDSAVQDPPGRQLFEGRGTLQARIPGHDSPLPAQAWRCANCHAGTQAVGGLMAPERLLAPQSRRGGPPSRYTLPDFCSLLRTGVDPAGILIDRSMPRFEIDDLQCEQLWLQLTRL